MKPKLTIPEIEQRARQMEKVRGWSKEKTASVILLVLVLRGEKE